jgi:hypothetical protein
MYNLKPKFKSALSVLIKTAVLGAATYFIYARLVDNKVIEAAFFFGRIKYILIQNKLIFILVLLLTIANWLLEIFKWQTLVMSVQKINFKTAASQCLSALTVSLFTPNRAGDYLAKSLYFRPDKTKKIVALNTIGHGLQLLVTVFFGLLGLTYLSFNYPISMSLNAELAALILFLTVLVLSLKVSQNWLKKLFDYYKSLHLKLFVKTGALSVFRYLIFSHQYYILLLLFGLKVDYLVVMPAVFSMYLLASLLPALSITDWIVKSSAAVFMFGFLKVSALLVLQVSLLMWILNFALPAIVGGVYVIKFKINQPKPVVLHL